MTSVNLLQGAWYALEQAGRLLESSTVLFDAGDQSTAVGLAMFGREELGRSRILRQLAEKAASGAAVTPQDVQLACEDHVDKQRKGTLSTTLRFEHGTGLSKLFRDRMHNPPASETWQKSDKELRRVTASKAKRTPDTRHQLRMHSLYVDIHETGSWQRPRDINPQEALNEITDALNDYAGECDRLRPAVLQQDFPEMAKALETMNPKPSLPLPRWPKGLA